MANPYHHALSSVKKWGGQVSDYQAIHNWFDATKAHFGDFRHRALRHHSLGIFEMEKEFGETLTLSTGKIIPTRWVGEQHVTEDLGYIPSVADWLKGIKPERWMNSPKRLSVELTEEALEELKEKAEQKNPCKEVELLGMGECVLVPPPPTPEDEFDKEVRLLAGTLGNTPRARGAVPSDFVGGVIGGNAVGVKLTSAGPSSGVIGREYASDKMIRSDFLCGNIGSAPEGST